ncbi:uncharacterized protein LOC126738637 [Anthonomus grandis grandis]|uniref:uncharacterized protein LOC126738637 n=1 Tax=Anthonomus grandis grandis TaxID=2921223 RepID=UPI0021665D67|nr:uncharacterized protein LOC126738637 [Anthonomus grandis grandis]
MAIPKTEKKVFDIMKADEMWKSFIKSEDDSSKIWQKNWGWIMDEYRELEKKLKAKSEQSKFLTEILEEKKEDPRKLTDFPETTNHEYGWIGDHEAFRLEIYGSDIFKAKPLPDIYHIPKH